MVEESISVRELRRRAVLHEMRYTPYPKAEKYLHQGVQALTIMMNWDRGWAAQAARELVTDGLLKSFEIDGKTFYMIDGGRAGRGRQ
jgi:hypothetical protein